MKRAANQRPLARKSAWFILAIGLTGMTSCGDSSHQSSSTTASNDSSVTQPVQHDVEVPEGATEASEYDRDRALMVEHQLAGRDIENQRVLDAMKRVPRHEFVPEDMRRYAYSDTPLPIGHDQTISQPYIVALMTQWVEPESNKNALDVGTGSGYQAAVLAELVKSVYSIEIVEPLAKQARERLERLGYENVTVKHGDGYQGWKSRAPFDIIVVAAAPEHVPQPLKEQLAVGGRMVIPVGDHLQQLLVIEKQPDGTTVEQKVGAVAFVPMTGMAEENGEPGR